ncbi:MAG: type I restriction enzyme EcoKI subunit R [Podoviridae sp. ctbj_2]|nr:MAG: type I restriction enzyme EcoKI subunit R [Podoviridae sp. ctbj_2]
MFKENTQETPAAQGDASTQPTNQSDPLATLLSEIQNERGEQKYKSVPDALNALKHSQAFISQQRTEKQEYEAALARMQEELEQMRSLKDTVQQLTERQAQASTKAPGLDEASLATLVESQLTKREKEALQRQNQTAVENALRQQFGDKAGEVFYGKAQEVGLSPEEMQSLAARSPAAVLTMLGVTGQGAHKQPGVVPAQTRLNTAAAPVQRATTYIGRETETIPIGGGAYHTKVMLENARNMVAELQEKGMTIDDLTIPSNYFKYFN